MLQYGCCAFAGRNAGGSNSSVVLGAASTHSRNESSVEACAMLCTYWQTTPFGGNWHQCVAFDFSMRARLCRLYVDENTTLAEVPRNRVVPCEAENAEEAAQWGGDAEQAACFGAARDWTPPPPPPLPFSACNNECSNANNGVCEDGGLGSTLPATCDYSSE